MHRENHCGQLNGISLEAYFRVSLCRPERSLACMVVVDPIRGNARRTQPDLCGNGLLLCCIRRKHISRRRQRVLHVGGEDSFATSVTCNGGRLLEGQD